MSPPLPPWVRPAPDGVDLDLLVQPRASLSRVVGAHGDRLKVQLAAPPVDGAANAELLEVLARALGVARKDVEITAGARGRRKRVRVRGAPIAAVLEALAVG